jgi:copper chaperone
MSEQREYSVPGMTCGHCEAAVTGVTSVVVNLETKLVTVAGSALDDAALRAAIDEAGFEAA